MKISGNITRRAALRAAASALAARIAAPAAPQPPNIVILLADDLGYGDVGFTGCPDIRTPNIDGIAREGVRFTRGYANGPVCSPTRAALLTGQYQQRNGMEHVILVAQREAGLSTDAVLLPQVLKPRGYVSGVIGKWHLGFDKRFRPLQRGFDEFFGFLSGNIDYFAHTDRLGNADLWRQDELVKDDRRYMSDLIGDESCAFIDRHKAEPFFLYAAFNSPHDPYQGPGDRATAGDQEVSRKKNRKRPVYRAMVESLDANIGRILSQLRKSGVEENTAVFFLSDNGGVPTVGRNAPFRGFKGSLWEGGIRSPLCARWKGRFPAGSTVDAPCAAMDLFATAAAIAGAKPPQDRPIDGVSLLGACLGKEGVPREALYFGYGQSRAVMQGNWKYLRAEKAEHLFRLDEDSGEANNLAAKDPQRLARMRAASDGWANAVYAPRS